MITDAIRSVVDGEDLDSATAVAPCVHIPVGR